MTLCESAVALVYPLLSDVHHPPDCTITGDHGANKGMLVNVKLFLFENPTPQSNVDAITFPKRE